MLIILFFSIFEKTQNFFFLHLRFAPVNVEQIDFCIFNMIHQQPPSDYLCFQIIYKPIKILALPTFTVNN